MSAEERRTARKAALLDAGLDVIGTHGWAGTTVRDVCRKAGLTEPYFYESFDDREALLLAVYDRVVAEGTQVVLAGVASAPRDFEATVRAGITAGVDWVTDDPRRGRLLAVESTVNETLQRRRQEALRVQADLMSQLAQVFFSGEPADRADAMLTSLAMVGAMSEVGSAYLAGRLDVSRERLIDHMTGIAVAASRVSSRGQPRG